VLNLIKILGFTGTQQGMTLYQRTAFRAFVKMYEPDEFHHGDCIGADADAHKIVRKVCPDCRIVIHPPKNPNKRAHCDYDAILPEKEYLDRNKDIVKVCSTLVATPYEREEQLRSGTWSTVRYARKVNREIALLLPGE
jgi:hypothetical protein